MKIQFNTDKNIDGSKKQADYFSNQISAELIRYDDYITRIEIHLSDENGPKDGINDIRCLIEARLRGKQPIAIAAYANTVQLAISGAISKLISSLEKIITTK